MPVIKVGPNRHAEALGSLVGIWGAASLNSGAPGTVVGHPRAMSGVQAIALAVSGYGERWRIMGSLGPTAHNWGAPIFPGSCASKAMGLAVDDPEGFCVPVFGDDAEGALAFAAEVLKLPELDTALASGFVEDLAAAVDGPVGPPPSAADLLVAVTAIHAALKMPGEPLWTTRGAVKPQPGPGAVPIPVPGFPGGIPGIPGTTAPPPAVVDDELSTGTKVGLGVAGLAAAAGVAWLAFRRKGRRR